MSLKPCLACASDRARQRFTVCEMMFGLGGSFEYWECAECGAIQIAAPPEDLARYYRAVGYYSFRDPRRGWLRASFKRQRARYAFTGRGTAGRLLTVRYGYPQIIGWLKEWIANAGLTPDQEILDVGCGNAPHFIDLMDVGFFHLTGVDPYIVGDIEFGRGVKVRKLDLKDVKHEYDFVMLHHSFEHMDDPRNVMRELIRVVKPGKYVLIRTPVAGSFAWRTYHANWVQLDAPRHLFIPSVQSMFLLAGAAGFDVARVVFDSDDLQFWGSEQYARGIPMMDTNWHVTRPRPGLFSETELMSFREHARQLNETGEGDSAAFYLRRPDPAQNYGPATPGLAMREGFS